MNEYMAIENGGCLCLNSLHSLMDASQRIQYGI